jgi:hypothetical protein
MDDRQAAERRLRGRNLAVLAALLGFALLMYVVTIVRMGGG